MFVLMRESKGVGLAAPQVGMNIRLFVMNATGKPEDDRVYINPVLTEAEGHEEEEEGCLSIPELRKVKITRAKRLRMDGPRSVFGQPVEQTTEGFVARGLAARIRPSQRHFDHRPHGRGGENRPSRAAQGSGCKVQEEAREMTKSETRMTNQIDNDP